MMVEPSESGSEGIALIPQLDPATNALPAGRYRADESEIVRRFVFNDHRVELWDEWSAATGLLRSRFPVCAAWLGGSYFTGKSQPSDIDCVYFIDAHHLVEIDEGLKNLVAVFANGGALSHHTGLRVDSYVVPWQANATPQRATPDIAKYYENRGYWDDLWSKMRSGPKNMSATRLDAHPRRGYLEVVLDGFSEEGSYFAG